MKTIAITIIYLAALVSVTPAQERQFPNELKGYEFFTNPKLKALKFYASTAADVKRLMGDSCENNCAYSEEWKISFSYVSSNWSKTIDGKLYRPKPEYVGKLADIGFRPIKPRLLTDGTVFPDGYRCDNGVTTNGSLQYISRSCIIEGAALILYQISNETISDGSSLVLNQQIMNISYGPPLKDRDAIFALVDK